MIAADPGTRAEEELQKDERNEAIESPSSSASSSTFQSSGHAREAAVPYPRTCADMGQPDDANRRLNEGFCQWMGRIEGELADVCGFEGKAREAACCRVAGPRFAMKPALGEIASPFPRVAPVTAAWWTVAAWLLQLLQALIATQAPGKPPNGRALCCICRVVRRFRLHKWADLGDLGDTEAFRHWFGAVKHHLLMNKQYVVWLRLDAQLRAKAASRRDIDARRRSWQSWLQEGPAHGAWTATQDVPRRRWLGAGAGRVCRAGRRGRRRADL